MNSFYLFDYIKNNFQINNTILDCLWYELDQHIYFYGQHFKSPKEQYKKNTLAQFIKNQAYDYILFYQSCLKPVVKTNKKKILSNVYFSTNQELKNLGFFIYCPHWSMKKGYSVLKDPGLFKCFKSLNKDLQKRKFIELLDDKFHLKINQFIEISKGLYKKNNISALFVPYDMPFYEKLTIRVFRELKRPSFIFLHGLPGRYNNLDDNRSDYLIVWGDKIRENYIKAGVSPDKIFVSGHPNYKDIKNQDLTFSLDNVLVITKAMSGAQHSDKVRLSDRGNLILYLYSIEKVLKQRGVKSARFRPHPSESLEWYLKFLNTEFYKPDKENIQKSILNSSLVIGPSSSVFLESLYSGINYVVYEPSFKDIDLINYELVPPFNGNEQKVPVAKNEEELNYLIKNKEKVDYSVVSDYLKPSFDLNFVKTLI